jgi:predicted nucleic acid-binding protein
MNILVDSGFLIALFASSATDKHHDSAVLARKKYWNAKLHTLWECVAEASHQLNTQGRKALLEWLARQERIIVHSTNISELREMSLYMTKYANASKYKGADITDVALVFLGARLKTSNIFTVDIEDFETYKTLSGKNFTRLWM